MAGSFPELLTEKFYRINFGPRTGIGRFDCECVPLRGVMTIETALHRWDGQDAHGRAATIDAELASDGMDEVLDVHVGLRLRGDGIDIGGSVHFHCTDTEGEWTVHTDDGLARVTRGHTKGDVAVRGPASSLLLVQWRRLPVDDPSLEIFGDHEVFTRWLTLPVP